MTPRMLGHLRSAATLGVLSLLLVYAVTRGLDAVSEPFPADADPPICVDRDLGAGDVLRTAAVTVSVVNAGGTVGLAKSTLDELVDEGFDPGGVSNLPDDEIRTAQIWSPGGPSPATRLLSTHLGGQVRVVDRAGSEAGLTVVVGDDFPGVRDGRGRVKVGSDVQVCGPAELG